MHVLHPHTRRSLSARDLEFIKCTLATRKQELKWIDELLLDPASRDQILDDESLTQALLEQQGTLEVSHYFFFYTLVRYALRRQKVFSREVADYVASLLAERLDTKKRACINNTQLYVMDFMELLQKADPYQSFQLTVSLANQSLFITGLFPEYLENRNQYRAAPKLHFYEAVGQAQFMNAGLHTLAQEHDLSPLYKSISKEFIKIRKSLNHFAKSMVFLTD